MYIHLLYGDARLFTNIINPIAFAFFKVRLLWRGDFLNFVFYVFLLLINVNICDRFYLCRKKTVLKQPVDKILAGMLIERHI